MKLLTRAQFLELPAGVFYAKNPQRGTDGVNSISIFFDDLCVKDETCRDDKGRAIDWWYRSLNSYDNEGDSNFYEQYMRLKGGESVPLLSSISRDGLFDQDDLFLVYEQADLSALAQLMQAAMAVTP